MPRGNKHAERREALRSLWQRTSRGHIDWPQFNEEISVVLEQVRDQTRTEILATLRIETGKPS